jgi:hypothetical protein
MSLAPPHRDFPHLDFFKPRPIAEYHEDMGPMLWWKFPITEPPYVGSPNDRGFTVHIKTKIATSCRFMEGPRPSARHCFDVGGWPGYHTHFTPIPVPETPK